MISNPHLASVLDLPSQHGERATEPRNGVMPPAAVWTWETDAELRIEQLSGAVRQGLGYKPDELIGARLDSLTATGSDGARLGELLNGRAPFRDLDLLLAQRDGSPGLFRLSGSPQFCPKTGEFVGFEGEGCNLTDSAAREAALRRLVESTEAANRSKRDFIANMSHDLRTPLNAIIGFSEIMAQQAFGPLGDERYKDYAQMTLDSANRLLRLISNLLDVANLEAGKLELEECEIDPAALLRGVLQAAHESDDGETPILTCECPTDLPLLYGDGDKLRQALGNLLSNAIKFTPPGGRVQLSARREANGGLSFAVEDSGVGIAPDDVATALAPFGQVKPDGNPCVEGSGLGLTLAKSLVELHGGRLTLDSEPGRGTVVTLCLPAWRCLPQSS
ncbi:MAG: ATP-binding protein [Kiloniellales bacterium]